MGERLQQPPQADPIQRIFVPRGSMLHVCERCGQQAAIKRAGVYGDELFLEIWHELHAIEAAYKEMEQRARRAEARLANQEGETQWYRDGQLWALEHIEFLSKRLLEVLPANESELI